MWYFLLTAFCAEKIQPQTPAQDPLAQRVVFNNPGGRPESGACPTLAEFLSPWTTEFMSALKAHQDQLGVREHWRQTASDYEQRWHKAPDVKKDFLTAPSAIVIHRITTSPNDKYIQTTLYIVDPSKNEDGSVTLHIEIKQQSFPTKAKTSYDVVPPVVIGTISGSQQTPEALRNSVVRRINQAAAAS